MLFVYFCYVHVNPNFLPPQVLGLPVAVGGNTSSERTTNSSGQHRTVHIAEATPALPEGVSPTLQGKTMNMESPFNSNRLARHPGNQGARTLVDSQARVDKLTTGHRHFGKRPRTLSTDYEPQGDYPRYLVISSQEDGLRKVSPIAVCKTLNSLVGEPEGVRRLGNGTLLVHVANEEQAFKLRDLKVFAGVSVKVTPHNTLNTCKGVIFSTESHLCTDDELQEWLEDHKVCNIHRISQKSGSDQLLILTFNTTVLPRSVPVGFEWCRVRTYIPNPRRCFKCQRYGHFSSVCTRAEVCANCSSTEHSHSRDNPCNLKSSCTNCGQEHPAYSKRCPRWLQEKEIITLKTTKDISFPQARRLVEQTNGPHTYAKVASYPTPTLRDSPKKKIQLDGMKAISKTTPTTSGTATPTDVGSRPDATTTPHDSAYSLSLLTKTTANLTKTSQSVFSTPLHDDTDNMETDDDDSLDVKDKNSHEFSDEDLNSDDEDYYAKTLVRLLKDKGYYLNKGFRKQILHCHFNITCSMLSRAGLHGDKNKLAKRVKLELNMIPDDTDTNEKEALQAICNHEFSEEQYRVLCILAGHKMATTTKKMALFFKKKGR